MIGKKIKRNGLNNWNVIVGQEDNLYILNDLESYLKNNKIGNLESCLRIWTGFSLEKYTIEDVE
jgi:hypothetical protein